MRTPLLALLLAFVSTGCIVRTTPVGHSRGPVVQGGRCPPGHVWADGRCHNRGHGHGHGHGHHH